MVQASKKITEKRLKWYGAHSAKNARCGNTREKKKRAPNLRWKDACKRDMTQAGLKEDNATNRAEWRKKLISYTGDPK